jgi:hypothetical protein
VNDTAGLPLTFGANGYRLLIKPLLPLKTVAANSTFILIGRHRFTSVKKFSLNITTIASIKAKLSHHLARLIRQKGVKLNRWKFSEKQIKCS